MDRDEHCVICDRTWALCLPGAVPGRAGTKTGKRKWKTGLNGLHQFQPAEPARGPLEGVVFVAFALVTCELAASFFGN